MNNCVNPCNKTKAVHAADSTHFSPHTLKHTLPPMRFPTCTQVIIQHSNSLGEKRIQVEMGIHCKEGQNWNLKTIHYECPTADSDAFITVPIDSHCITGLHLKYQFHISTASVEGWFKGTDVQRRYQCFFCPPIVFVSLLPCAAGRALVVSRSTPHTRLQESRRENTAAVA